jgi:hypothetical protein
MYVCRLHQQEIRFVNPRWRGGGDQKLFLLVIRVSAQPKVRKIVQKQGSCRILLAGAGQASCVRHVNQNKKKDLVSLARVALSKFTFNS